MKTMTAQQAYRSVLESAEAIRNDAPATIDLVSPGDGVRQGDLYLDSLDTAPARSKPWASRQLAPGTTQGSRHVVEGDCELYLPDQGSATEILNRVNPATRDYPQLFGPTIVAHGPVTITHPEHGHRTLPAGIWQVGYQRAFAEELRRQYD